MRNKPLSIILKAVALVASWLMLSPLLLILDGRWKLLPKWLRIVLFVLSPMIVILVWLALIFGSGLNEYKWSNQCEHRYEEAYAYEYEGAELHRLRVLSGEEIDTLIADLKKKPGNRVEVHKFAHQKIGPAAIRDYGYDRYFEREVIIDNLMEKRNPNDTIELSWRNIDVYSVKNVRCPHCWKKQVVLFEYCSPLWTWQNLCGRDGPMLYCPHCDRIIYYEWCVIN